MSESQTLIVAGCLFLAIGFFGILASQLPVTWIYRSQSQSDVIYALFNPLIYFIYPPALLVPIGVLLSIVVWVYLYTVGLLKKYWWIPLALTVLSITVYVVVAMHSKSLVQLY